MFLSRFCAKLPERQRPRRVGAVASKPRREDGAVCAGDAAEGGAELARKLSVAQPLRRRDTGLAVGSQAKIIPFYPVTTDTCEAVRVYCTCTFIRNTVIGVESKRKNDKVRSVEKIAHAHPALARTFERHGHTHTGPQLSVARGSQDLKSRVQSAESTEPAKVVQAECTTATTAQYTGWPGWQPPPGGHAAAAPPYPCAPCAPYPTDGGSCSA